MNETTTRESTIVHLPISGSPPFDSAAGTATIVDIAVFLGPSAKRTATIFRAGPAEQKLRPRLRIPERQPSAGPSQNSERIAVAEGSGTRPTDPPHV
jgi:hypothetical protein